MFNELCRVTMMEDILESEDFLGEDFSDLAAYIDFAYGEEFTAWFRVDAAPDSAGLASSRWERVASALGTRQGGPMSGFFCAVALIRVLRKARDAIDEANGLVRCPGQGSAEQRKLAHDLAAKAGDVVSYHDDASLLARISALCKAYGAYATAAAGRNWQCVPKKSMLSGMWYGQDVSAGEQRSMDLSHFTDSGPRAWQVEILPGVEVTYCVDGFVNLGVPMGTEAYVQHQLNKQLGEQAVTMRRVVNYANDESTATRHLDYGLSRGIALNIVRFCCNQRDVHFLRALPLRVLGDAINAHDRGVLQAVAGVMAHRTAARLGSAAEHPRPHT